MLQFKRVTASAVAAIILALPASAVAQYQDLRGEHARDAARQSELRDQRQWDMRNPDRRAADTGVRVPPVQPPAPEVRVVEVASDGFDWGDAGIGAAGGVAILTLAGGMAAIATHRRRSAAMS
jgi:hypothetical protein